MGPIGLYGLISKLMLAAKYFVLWYSGACPHKPNIAVAENE
jgi:hypothetical protein